jgi:membrane protease YdiL (CAAX protease family)
LADIRFETLRTGLTWGLIGTLPMLGYLAVFHFWPVGILKPMREFVDSQLRPLFSGLSIFQMIIISVSAGCCEEILFRWSLQGGITSWIGGLPGLIVGGVVASVIFGVCHWVNFSYAFCTFLIGIFLGVLMICSGTWLAPAITHTLFDFVALLYLRSVK